MDEIQNRELRLRRMLLSSLLNLGDYQIVENRGECKKGLAARK